MRITSCRRYESDVDPHDDPDETLPNSDAIEAAIELASSLANEAMEEILGEGEDDNRERSRRLKKQRDEKKPRSQREPRWDKLSF